MSDEEYLAVLVRRHCEIALMIAAVERRMRESGQGKPLTSCAAPSCDRRPMRGRRPTAEIDARRRRILTTVNEPRGNALKAKAIGEKLGIDWRAVNTDLDWLEESGFIRKDEFGRLLTDAGRSWLEEHARAR